MPSGEHKRPCASFHWPLWAKQIEDRISFFPPVCSQPLLLTTSPSQDNQTTLSFLFFISILKHRDVHWSFSDSLYKSVWIWMNIKMPFVGVCKLTVYLHFIYYTTYFLFLLPRLVLCDLCLVFLSSHLPSCSDIPEKPQYITVQAVYYKTTWIPLTLWFIELKVSEESRALAALWPSILWSQFT